MKRKTWKKVGRALAGLLGLLVSLSVCVWGLWTPLPVRAGDAGKETGQAKETEEEEIQGADEREIQEEILSRFDFDEIDASLKELFPEERLEFRSVLEDVLSGDLTLTAELFNQLIADQFTYAVRTGKDQLVHMLMIALIAAVFSNFSKVFQSRQLSEISFYALYLLMIALALNTFSAVTKWVESGIEALTSFGCVLSFVFCGSGGGKRQCDGCGFLSAGTVSHLSGGAFDQQYPSAGNPYLYAGPCAE